MHKFLLASDKFMSEMHLKQSILLIVIVAHLLKPMKELNSLYKQEMQILFTKVTLIKLIFSMICHMINQNF